MAKVESQSFLVSCHRQQQELLAHLLDRVQLRVLSYCRCRDAGVCHGSGCVL